MLAMTMLGASLVMAAGGDLVRGPSASGDPTPTPRIAAGASASANRTAGERSPEATSSPTEPSGPPGPTLAGPAATFTNRRLFDVGGTLPDGITQRSRQRIAVYVDGKLTRQARLPSGVSFVVKGVPLRLGKHRITASVRGPRGETRQSDPITVTVDLTPPRLQLSRPAEGQVINADQATFEGVILGGDQVSIRNETSGAIAPASPTPKGAFVVDVPMAPGANIFIVSGRDRAGNGVEVRLEVLRGEDRATAGLRLSSERIRISRLPATIWVEAHVRDADRRPIPDAPVTFTLSPPGQPTTTYRATTDQLGFARWEKVTLPRDGAQPGKGFATVHVAAPDGETIQETVPFTFE